MRVALQFGAGNIGRGFMGQLFREAGLHTVQIDSNGTLVELINSRRRYTLTLLNAYTKQAENVVIDDVEAASVAESDRISRLFAEAEVAGTAVGVGNLPALAPLIASGIAERRRSGGGALDIYVCENALDAAQILKKETFRFLDQDLQAWADSSVGFVGASVARIVPPRSDRYGGDDPLSVVADAYSRLPYDHDAARAAPLACPWMSQVQNFRAELERKFSTHNLGHAALGYLGYLRGFRYIHEPFDDEFSRNLFEGALDETSRSLLAKYPADLDPAEHQAVRSDVRIRFANPLLQDTVTRVAREPIRKLRPGDRLISSARLCLAQGVFPRNIFVVCAAALLYDNPKDAEAMTLHAMTGANGVDKVLEEITSIAPESPEGRAILDAYSFLQEHKRAERKS